MANQAELLNALCDLHSRGPLRIGADAMAAIQSPGSRSKNAYGLIFPLSTGAAGNMLKACRTFREIAPIE